MDIWDIRLTNLKTLIRLHAGGNNRKFVDVARLESHIALLHVTGPRRTRNLGPRLARQIERNLGLEDGWMDRNHTPEGATATAGDERTVRALKLYTWVETLPPEAREALEHFFDVLGSGQKKANRRKKKPDSPKR